MPWYIPFLPKKYQNCFNYNERQLQIMYTKTNYFRILISSSVLSSVLLLRSSSWATANMTNIFQPRDVSVNKAAKDLMRASYCSYYQVLKQLQAGVAPHDVKVDRTFKAINVMHADWIVNAWKDLCSERGRSIILKGFRKSGIRDALDMVSSPELNNPFIEIWIFNFLLTVFSDKT